MLFQNTLGDIKVTIAVSQISDGDMSSNWQGDDAVLRKYLSQNGFEVNNFIDVEQTHSTKIIEAKVGERAIGDGLITRNSAKTLVVKLADCLPVVLVNSKKRTVCLLHCGYKGILDGIIQKAISQLFKSDEDVHNGYAFLGPCICGSCYSVTKPRYEAFGGKYPFSVLKKKNKYYVDIRSTALHTIISNGIPASNVKQLECCTKEDSRFFSYRRGDKMGRFVTAVSFKYV